MSIIQINGVDMPDPSDFSVVIQSIDSDNTNRNEQGVLQRDRVRDGVHKLTLKWNALTGANASAVLQAVSPASFRVSFTDPLTNAPTTLTLYSGDRTAAGVGTAKGMCWNISFDNIEY